MTIGSILQDIPHGLSAGAGVCVCGQGGSHWGPETACPWCKPANICCLPDRCFGDEIPCSALSSSKNQPLKNHSATEAESPPTYSKEGIFPSQCQKLLQMCQGFKGLCLPHATCKAGVGSVLAEGSFHLGFAQKNFQWGHRGTLRATGLCKQLFAQTNVQQPKSNPLAQVVHLWCLHVCLS